MPGFKSNVGILNSVLRNAPKENKDMIRDLIRLYETKKIKNFRTAENAINRLGTKTKNKERVDRAKKDYIDIMKRYATAEPMTGRLTRESEKRKLKNVMLTMVLWLLAEGFVWLMAEGFVWLLAEGFVWLLAEGFVELLGRRCAVMALTALCG